MAKRPTTKAAGTTPAAASTTAAPAATAQAAADKAAADKAEADRLAAEKAAADNAEAARLAADEAEFGGFDMAGRTIFVRSVSPLGRRRAGHAFGSVPVPVAIDDLTEDQLAAILADTDHLVITLDS